MRIVCNDQINNLSPRAQIARDLRMLKATMTRLHESREILNRQIYSVKKIFEEKQ
ncbi:MAG: hypothetical protein JXB50_12140 [Spirochaetes bacterium]|nr:hypothetical protein [Spirochaetota bacterium]